MTLQILFINHCWKPYFLMNSIYGSLHQNKRNQKPTQGFGVWIWVMKFTQHTLDKVEKIIEDCGYIIRYERGTFQSGYCILQEKKVVVLNKFLQTEGRINTLIDLLPQLNINFDALTLESQKLYSELMQLETTK